MPEQREARNPYNNWSLAETINDHSDRIRAFLTRKGIFESQRNAEGFWTMVKYEAGTDYSALDHALRLKDAFSFFGEAQRDYRYGDAYSNSLNDARRTRAVGEQMIQTLQLGNAPVRFPSNQEKPSSFVDIGCGLGETTSALAEFWGLDKSHAIGIDIAQQPRIPENIDFYRMDPDVLPPEIQPDSQDLVVVSMVLHHSYHPDQLIDRIKEVLKPGGFLVLRDHDLSEPTLASFINAVHVLYEQIFSADLVFVPNAMSYKPMQVWQQVLESAGFSMIRTDYEPYPQNPKNTCNNFAMVLKR